MFDEIRRAIVWMTSPHEDANLGSWARQLRARGFPDAPEEYLQRP